MLFPYKYINHNIEKMQIYIDYIFYEVWCKAPNYDREFELKLFDGNADLKDIIIDFWHTKPAGAEFFIIGIQEIFSIFKTLTPDEVTRLRTWYRSNNDIEILCRNDSEVIPTTYQDIAEMNEKLSIKLKEFFVGLYSQSFLSLKILANKIGSIDDHYKEFVKSNSNGKCPFCGLYPIDGEYDHTREAYDHYLPKSKYPFSTINLRNLAPICNKCNSGNKLSKDPLHDIHGNRRKAFYPYNVNPYDLEISVTVNSNDYNNLIPEDIDISFKSENLTEELITWDDLFNIRERYKAVCCSADAKYWISQIFEECGDKSPYEFLLIRLNCAQKFPYSDTNFLRVPFLKACDEQHVFSIQQSKIV